MKIILFTVWILVKAVISPAQPGGHIGFGNTYTYSEKDGIDESNFFVSGIVSDGRVFFHGNTGSLFIKGNNYTRKIKLSPAVSAIRIDIVLESGNNQFVAFGNNFYYVIENDSITIVRRFPEPSVAVRIGNELIAASSISLYRFEKDSFVCKVSVPKIAGSATFFFADENNKLWRITSTGDKSDYYRINDLWKAEFQFSLHQSKVPGIIDTIINNKPVRIYLTLISNSFNQNYAHVRPDFQQPYYDSKISFSFNGFQHSILTNLRNSDKERLHIQYADKLLTNNLFDFATESYYFSSYKKPFRYFPYLRKYPKVFDHTTSAAINAIQQDSSGRIWVGSYESGLSVIEKNKMMEFRRDGLIFLPGSFSSGNHVYLISELVSEDQMQKSGLFQYDMHGHKKGLSPGTVGYSIYLSKDKQHFYFGTAYNKGLWMSDIQSLESGKPHWKKIDSTYGNNLKGVECIAEDAKSRIWMGGPGMGFAVYYPDKDKAKTWLIYKNETSFDFWSACTDDKGTVWLGTGQRGLMYYNDYGNETIATEKIFKIEHPLLPEGTKIMQLKVWGSWLIIGTVNDILLLDLDKWYKTKKVFIRYLNPQEGNFTARPQQNTVLIDKRDSSVWFATSDMLYQWNIKQWLSLPTYTIKPNLVLHTSSGDSLLTENHEIKIKPTKNTLHFSLWFQSRDNMPRYMSVTLIKKGDSLFFPSPSLQTQFDYTNLAPGNYELAIQICQSDGSVSIHSYPILIKKFWWQYWWVWAIMFAILSTLVLLWITYKNKARLAEEKAKRKEAELETVKAERQKMLSALQIVSLSNQFRPHFILNALNTVGAELDNKPQAESVLSRLGESIDLIFSHAQQQKTTHSLADEWRLVNNVIDIHHLMYLKNLETYMPPQPIVEKFSSVKIPLGLLQIQVENALLHGLSNRESSPWKLVIEINESDKNIIISVSDNGVGRVKAATLSNYRKHGTGTKNLSGILEILNNGKLEKISVDYEDGIYNEGNEYYGTKAIITIPKNFKYET